MKNFNFLYIIMAMLLFPSNKCFSRGDAKDRRWTFHIEEVALDSLRANFRGNSTQNIIYFEKEDNNTWGISVPDSIYYGYDLLNIYAYRQDKGWCDVLLFDSPKFVKHNVSNALYFADDKDVFVTAKTVLVPDNNNNILLLETAYTDKEYIIGKKMANLVSEMNCNEILQQEALDTVFKYVESNPNSFVAMKLINSFLFNEIKYDTYEKLYSIFTDAVKNTPSGKGFRLYLKDRQAYESSTKIRIFDLQRSDNGKVEPFITDNGKYKLIIFSSVGCSPCHKAIPIYKQIYGDLYGKLDMLYISVDEKDMAGNWNVILEKYEIPWRSYFSYDIEGRILQKYMLRSVPSSLLVKPDLTFEKIDVRNEEDRAKLYELVNKQE